MSFTTTKDRIWSRYDLMSGWLARQPRAVRNAGYGCIGAVLWAAYLLPGNHVRPTFAALAGHLGRTSGRRLFAAYVGRFVRGLGVAEQIRHGHAGQIDGRLRIADEERFTSLLRGSGVVLVAPHFHSMHAMGRALALRYPMLTLVRLPTDPVRAKAEWSLYQRVGCDFLDVRNEKPAAVARQVLKALSEGKIVLGAVDRIDKAPPAGDLVVAKKDKVRATAFGQPVGVAGWPVRFAAKAGVPIVPAMAVQSDDAITVEFGAPTWPTGDIVDATQAWVDRFEALVRAHPEEWTFVLDKHWSRVLRSASNAAPPVAEAEGLLQPDEAG
jgi:lauroyl/myristoyl acyltransferase